MGTRWDTKLQNKTTSYNYLEPLVNLENQLAPTCHHDSGLAPLASCSGLRLGTRYVLYINVKRLGVVCHVLSLTVKSLAVKKSFQVTMSAFCEKASKTQITVYSKTIISCSKNSHFYEQSLYRVMNSWSEHTLIGA